MTARQTIKVELYWKKRDLKIQKAMREALMETIKTFTGITDAEVMDIKITRIDLKH